MMEGTGALGQLHVLNVVRGAGPRVHAIGYWFLFAELVRCITFEPRKGKLCHSLVGVASLFYTAPQLLDRKILVSRRNKNLFLTSHLLYLLR